MGIRDPNCPFKLHFSPKSTFFVPLRCFATRCPLSLHQDPGAAPRRVVLLSLCVKTTMGQGASPLYTAPCALFVPDRQVGFSFRHTGTQIRCCVFNAENGIARTKNAVNLLD